MPRGHSAVPAWCGPERFSPIDNSRHSASQPSWLYHTHVCWRREQDETAFLARLPGNVDYETASNTTKPSLRLALGVASAELRLYSGCTAVPLSFCPALHLPPIFI